MRNYCVISHTHWDREWYQTQEEFRLRLVDLIDHLLEILDADPEYIFHMDAQMIVFEDYLEIKPKMREKCCRYIKEGRILAGPWYVQNDFFLTSGEATVRNLLIGTKQANEMGGCANTGYTPDQFGLISQLPQIFRGFDLDHCIMGRGYASVKELGDSEDVIELKPSEFIWQSPDGSEVLGIHMSHWYNNAQRFSEDIDKACRLVQNVKKSFEGIAETPYLLLMNGVDHLEPQPNLIPILREIQKRLPDDEKIYQTTMEHYADLVRNFLNRDDMPVEVGELMHGRNTELLKDTASSRVYLKRTNSKLQNMLEHCLEPLYALLELSGMKGVYPADYLDYLWKMLIRNHAHDSICGCSKDAVHSHMEDRFAAIREIADELIRRGMKLLASHIGEGINQDDYQIVVFNGLEHNRTETVDVIVDIVDSDCPKGLKITSSDGREITFKVINEYKLGKSVFSAINLPGTKETRRYEVRMSAENVPAFGYAVYRVQTDEKTPICEGSPIAYIDGGNHCLENDDIKAVIMPSGRVDLYYKKKNRCYRNIFTVKDVADVGNTYIFEAAQDDVPISISDFDAEISVVQSDIFSGTICLHYDIPLPLYYDFANNKRSGETVNVPISIFVGLKKDSKSLDVRLELENRAKDHRMSIFVQTGLNSDEVFSTSPYDIVKRSKWDIDVNVCNETEHTDGMVLINENDEGIAVLNRGIYAYEHLQGERGTLCFPVVRATGAISAGVDSDDDAWKTPENQCLRKIECEISIMPQCGSNLAEKSAFAAKAFQNPLIAQCEPADTRKFLGGRPAVQDTTVAELFYQAVPYPDIQLRRTGFGINSEGCAIQVTALKKSFDRTGYILRFYNSSDESQEAVLDFGELKVNKVWKTNLKETLREEISAVDNKIQIPVNAKEIITLFFI